MELLRDAHQTDIECIRHDPAFGLALLDDNACLIENGETQVAGLVLRDLVEATVGFDRLASVLGPSATDIRHMLSQGDAPSETTRTQIEQMVRDDLLARCALASTAA